MSVEVSVVPGANLGTGGGGGRDCLPKMVQTGWWEPCFDHVTSVRCETLSVLVVCFLLLNLRHVLASHVTAQAGYASEESHHLGGEVYGKIL